MKTGHYQGTSHLHLSWLPEGERLSECESTIDAASHSDGKMITMTLNWSHEAIPQIGGFLIVADREKGSAEIGWTDTWHMAGAIMHSKGTAGSDSVSATGTYGDAESGIWSWRTDFTWTGDSIDLLMTNISPDGDEEWAVKAAYKLV